MQGMQNIDFINQEEQIEWSKILNQTSNLESKEYSLRNSVESNKNLDFYNLNTQQNTLRLSQQSDQSDQVGNLDEIMQNYENALRERSKYQQLVMQMQKKLDSQNELLRKVPDFEKEIENLLKKNEQLLQILQTKENTIQNLENQLLDNKLTEQQIFQSEQVQSLIFQNQQLLQKCKEMEQELEEKDRMIEFKNERILNVEQLLIKQQQSLQSQSGRKNIQSHNEVSPQNQESVQKEIQSQRFNSSSNYQNSNNSNHTSRQSSRPNSRMQNQQFTLNSILANNKNKNIGVKRAQSASRAQQSKTEIRNQKSEDTQQQFIYKPLHMLYKDNQIPAYIGGQKQVQSARSRTSEKGLQKGLEEIRSPFLGNSVKKWQDSLRGKPNILQNTTKILTRDSSLKVLQQKNSSRNSSPMRVNEYTNLDWKEQMLKLHDKHFQQRANQNQKYDFQFSDFPYTTHY